MEDTVIRVISDMRRRYRDPLSLNDLARTAILSPFHFSRVFRQTTGVSPGRYLAAVRLAEAQRLLRTTSWSVGDISCEVGYNSLGTFTTLFTKSVGVSPARFRKLGQARGQSALPKVQQPSGGRLGSLRGSLHFPDPDARSRVYLGVFSTAITQGMPMACQVLDGAVSREWHIPAVHDGEWYVHAIVVPSALSGWCTREEMESNLVVGIAGPITVERGEVVDNIEITMRRRCQTDAPILLALPGLFN